ncbi:hypothetical protein FBG13_07010 [Cobetia marina]|nr:hypothetical protein FBG13_07010 [Cobetia marina]
MKKFKRISTRYERLARNYQSLLSLVSAIVWLARLLTLPSLDFVESSNR